MHFQFQKRVLPSRDTAEMVAEDWPSVTRWSKMMIVYLLSIVITQLAISIFSWRSTCNTNRATMTSSIARIGGDGYHYCIPFLVAYAGFGLLHEMSHAVIASAFLRSSSFATLDGAFVFVKQALLGRYCIIEVDGFAPASALAIRHFGWIFSLALAAGLHYWHTSTHRCCGKSGSKPSSIWLTEPIIVVAAYVTAVEAVSTDLLGFVPIFGRQVRTCNCT